jgi:hypothetical protein
VPDGHRGVFSSLICNSPEVVKRFLLAVLIEMTREVVVEMTRGVG